LKSRVFDPFPFPDPPEPLRQNIRAIAEELDAHRKARQAEHPRLTLTQIYNVLEKLRAHAPLAADDERIKSEGLVLILKELHDRLDELVFQAYGWPQDLSDAEVIARLVALNKERAEEEARGIVRWLRPDYQKARAGILEDATPKGDVEQRELSLAVEKSREQKPRFPDDEVARTAVIMTALAVSRGAIDAKAIAATFRQSSRIEPEIRAALISLVRDGLASPSDNGRTFRLRRVA
jgi:hypothetical protein